MTNLRHLVSRNKREGYLTFYRKGWCSSGHVIEPSDIF